MSEFGMDFSKLSDTELHEFLQRQRNLLKNSRIIEKLVDRGAKIKEKLAALENEVSRRSALKETATQLEQLCLEESSICEGSLSRQEQLPKFCKKLEGYDKHRDIKSKFKPFSTLNHTIKINPNHAAKWESFPNLKAEVAVKEIPVLSLQDSLEIAALQQKVLKNLYLEDAANFNQAPLTRTVVTTSNQTIGDFKNYRCDKNDHLDSDDDSVLDQNEFESNSGF